MQKKVYKTISEYLACNNIDVVANFKTNIDYKKNITQKQIIDQLNSIVLFHSKMKGSDKCILEKINNTTGKIVEKYKIQLSILKRNVEKIKNNSPSNDFEEILIEKAPYFIEKADNSINEIYLNRYMNLIVRSMDNSEICLGNTYFSNLKCINNQIQICNTKKLSYNMVEIDGYYLFSKLKKKKLNLDFNEIISEFCYLENLNDDSFKFISFLLEYPSEFIKCCNRYFYKKKNYDINKYHSKLLKAINIDKHYLKR